MALETGNEDSGRVPYASAHIGLAIGEVRAFLSLYILGFQRIAAFNAYFGLR